MIDIPANAQTVNQCKTLNGEIGPCCADRPTVASQKWKETLKQPMKEMKLINTTKT